MSKDIYDRYSFNQLKLALIDSLSQELFNKNCNDLSEEESCILKQYLYDIEHPKWSIINIKGEPSSYSISNTGQVKNNITGILLKPSMGSNGYYHVTIRRIEHGFSKAYTYSIHRLVAIAFIPNPENKPVVNHKNCKKTVNWVGNLEWNTVSENTLHAINNGLQVPMKGSDNPLHIYSDDQIRNVCELLENRSITVPNISNITGVSECTIYNIAIGKRWKHISKNYNIKFKERPHRSIEERDRVCDFIRKGYSTSNIINNMEWDNTGTNRSFINYYRKKILSSTTIETLCD